MLTRDELVSVMPRAGNSVDQVIPALDAAMQRFDIANPARRAAFLAQLAHESGEFRRWTENLSYRWQRLREVFPKYFRTDAEAQTFDRQPERIANRVYGGRLGNGNEASGDGWRYRGRGPIQLTGKDNYRTCGEGIGVDLVNAPERLETPEVGCLAAAWFWASKGLNALADAGDFVTITKRINGGLIGLDDRTAFWKRAKAAFGVTSIAVAAPRARRGIAGGAAARKGAEQSAVAAPEKAAKQRATATKARAGARAEKVDVISAEKAGTKAASPRAAAAKKKTKAAKPTAPATKKAATKAAKPRTATTAQAEKKRTKPRIAKAKKTATKVAELRGASANKTGKRKTRPSGATARTTGNKAGKPRATAAKIRAIKASGVSRARVVKKPAKKPAKARPAAV
jgi:putative chitinase